MEQAISVSIIIPVYNTGANYLIPCMDAALAQTFKHIEIIVVNDGSTALHVDPLLKKYVEQDKRVIYFVKENGGAASARNKGVENAKGEFAFFLDADDVLMPDAIQVLYHKAIETNADVVIGNYAVDYANKYIEKKNFLQGFSAAEMIKSFMLFECHIALWAKLFRLDLFTQNYLDVPAGIHLVEDAMTSFQMAIYSKKTVQIDHIIQKYVINTKSITSKLSAKGQEALLTLIRWNERFFSEKFDYKIVENELASYQLQCWIWFLASGAECRDEDIIRLVYEKYLKNDFARKRISKENLLLIKKERNLILKHLYNAYAKGIKPIVRRFRPQKYDEK